MEILARREHSRLELEYKLQRRVVSNEILVAALDQLAEDRLLSDERFCETFVRSRVEAGYGPMRIRAELRERGVSDALISRYLIEDHDYWRQRLVALVNRKFGPEPCSDIKSQLKQQRFLLQRGYTFEQIRTVLANGKAD